jgi:hypothetical protein
MEPRIFHGNLTPLEIGRALIAEINRENIRAQMFGNPSNLIVQIATRPNRQSGGTTAISVSVKQVEDGVAVQLGNQAWMGVAASVGQTILSTWRNPWNILSRLDDLAQDIESFNISDKAWGVIENVARSAGASFELSERLRRIECEYCGTANHTGESNCIACGAPLGKVQPDTCRKCGFVIQKKEKTCPNCGTPIKTG